MRIAYLTQTFVAHEEIKICTHKQRNKNTHFLHKKCVFLFYNHILTQISIYGIMRILVSSLYPQSITRTKLVACKITQAN